VARGEKPANASICRKKPPARGMPAKTLMETPGFEASGTRPI
jgi:hypothetical protein